MTTPNPQKTLSTLATSMAAIFGGEKSSATLSTGFEIDFKTAKMKQLGYLLQMFQTITGAVDQESLVAVLEIVAAKQRETVEEGGPANTISLTQADMVSIGANNLELMFTLFRALHAELPVFVEQFTNMEPDAFDDVDITEGVLIILGIIGVNYAFFTRHLLPALTESLTMLVAKSKKQVIQNSEQKTKREKNG